MSGARRAIIEAPTLAPRARVQVQPGTMLWQTGARFGEVVAVRHRPSECVLVKLDTGRRDWLDINLVLEA